MIDTIWLILHHSTVNYKIDFMAEVGAKINVDIKRSNEYRIVGSLQNMQIYIEPTFVLIQGSLPKYYYGSNLVSLPRTELSNAIDKLSTDLGLPLREAIITRIDIGMNVEVDNPPRSYFSYFGILKKFERNIRRNSLYYEQKWCQLCFYDKVKEAKAHKDPLLTSEMLDKNILRYEIRYKHSWLKHYFKRNIKAKELFSSIPLSSLSILVTTLFNLAAFLSPFSLNESIIFNISCFLLLSFNSQRNKPINVISNFGFMMSILILSSYLRYHSAIKSRYTIGSFANSSFAFIFRLK